VRSDGIRGIYRGLVVAVLSIFFYRGLYFGIYDTGKEKLFNPDSKLWMKFFWAQASVIIAELLSYPGDTVKRKLMMQSRKETKDYNGMTDCFQKVYKTEGIQGLWRGSFSNILRGVGSSLCLILYDEIKKVFTENS
jgi:solute carrier family 25 (adenine nucleotide translocator) protein 4/5/6/31